MIPVESMRGRTVAVLGLGLSGRAAGRALAAGGAQIWAWDDAAAQRAAAAAEGLPLVRLDLCNWSRVDRLVLSPGIPHRHPRPHRLVRQARAAGVPVVGDVELLVENQPTRQIVGITGTNGKSTTTALLGELLRHAGRGVQVGGNIGLPVLDLLPKPLDDIYALELSSYQLELTEHLACAAAVILNISPDHLDRHGGMAGYVLAKRRILRNQRASDCAIIGVDDAYGQALAVQVGQDGPQRVIPVAVTRRLAAGISAEHGILVDGLDGALREVMDLRPLERLRGQHNWQNAAAAYAAVRALGLDPDSACAGMSRFEGLPHRMELVAEVDGVRFINDSKATNAEAAARALASYDDIFWIAGGRPKQGGLEGIGPGLDRVRQAFLIGEAAPGFAAVLAGEVPVTRSGDLATALHQAAEVAWASGLGAPVVLLAPACASFDQFENFEARGEAFRRLVAELAAARQQPRRAG